MLKLISLLKRAEGLSKEDFATWVAEDHFEFAKNLPGLRKYTVNVAVADDAPYDAVNEMWFDDEDARAAAFASDAGKAAAGDAGAHTSSRTHVVSVEHELIT
jgi:uncharacterized protein (TIGR02118 family)